MVDFRCCEYNICLKKSGSLFICLKQFVVVEERMGKV